MLPAQALCYRVEGLGKPKLVSASVSVVRIKRAKACSGECRTCRLEEEELKHWAHPVDSCVLSSTCRQTTIWPGWVQGAPCASAYPLLLARQSSHALSLLFPLAALQAAPWCAAARRRTLPPAGLVPRLQAAHRRQAAGGGAQGHQWEAGGCHGEGPVATWVGPRAFLHWLEVGWCSQWLVWSLACHLHGLCQQECDCYQLGVLSNAAHGSTTCALHLLCCIVSDR